MLLYQNMILYQTLASTILYMEKYKKPYRNNKILNVSFDIE